MLDIVNTEKAPKAVGPYSQAIKVGNLVFCSGQLGLDPKTNNLVEGLENQTKQVLANMKAIIEESGSSIENVVKTTIFLTNIQDFALVNEIYANFFSSPFPARSTIEVSNLPKGACIEIECIAKV